MKITEEISANYNSRRGQWEDLLREAIHALECCFKEEGLKYHSLTGRVKTLASIEGKLQRKAAKNSEIKEEISKNELWPMQFGLKDIVGVRVVCLFLSQVDHIAELIRKIFTVTEEDRKIAGNDVASFGYMSDHFVCTLNDQYQGPRYNAIKSISFEIQVRTIAMDAWANISHSLDYKGDTGVPNELRRDFHALSGLFYVADTHFEVFYKQVEGFRKKLEGEPSINLIAHHDDLNLDTLTAYLRQRFPQRIQQGRDVTSGLLQELTSAGYKNLHSLDQKISRGEKAMLEHEKRTPPMEDDGFTPTQFSSVGAVRVAIGFANGRYKHLRPRTSKASDVPGSPKSHTRTRKV